MFCASPVQQLHAVYGCGVEKFGVHLTSAASIATRSSLASQDCELEQWCRRSLLVFLGNCTVWSLQIEDSRVGRQRLKTSIFACPLYCQ